MRRRQFIALLGSAAAAWPAVARAQQGERMRRIGVLFPGSESGFTAPLIPLFRRGLQELGWIEGRNLRMDVRFGDLNIDRVRMLARELADLQPDVIVVNSSMATKAVQEQTRTIPIVFVFAGDPVVSGTVSNISRPEGNTTGVTDLFPSIGGKWLELLKEAVPRLARVALILHPDFSRNEAMLGAIETAAAQYAVKAIRAPCRNDADIARAMAAFAVEPDGGVISVPGTNHEAVWTLALQHRLPSIYNGRHLAAGGGLMSYGADVADLFRRGGPNYVDRILRGAKPSELPVQFSTKFELVINLKTAKAIGLTIPESFLLRADELIE